MRRLLAAAAVLGVFLLGFTPTASAGVVGPYTVTFTPYPNATLTMWDEVNWHQNTDDSRDVWYKYHFEEEGYVQDANPGVGVWARCCGGGWTRVWYSNTYPLNDLWYEITITPSVRPDLPHEWKVRVWFYDSLYDAEFYRETPIVYN
jgi:hypothetical protein